MTRFICGGECGVGAAGATLSPDAKHFATWGATITNVTGGRNSGRAIQVACVGGSDTFRPVLPASQNLCTLRFYIKFVGSLPTANCILFVMSMGAGGWPSLFYQSSDTKLYAAFSTTPGATGVTVVADVWYRIDMKIDTSANPRTVDVQVDGTACGQASSAVAASTFATIRFGPNGTSTTATVTILYDDIFIEFGSNALYPVGAGRVDALYPTADGTHGFDTAGDFIYNAAGGNIATSATDTYSYVDDLLTGTSDFINAAACVQGEYVEWTVGTLPGTADSILGVEFVSAWHAAATQANKAALRIVDGGSNGDAITDPTDVSNTTIGFFSKHFDTKPSGGAWTQSTLQGLKLRFGSSFATAEDVTPDVYCDGVRLEVAWVESTGVTVTPSVVSAAFSIATPSVVKGVRTLTPSAVTAAWATTTPTLIKVRTLTPSPATAAWSVFTPTIVKGVRTLTPSAVTAAWSVFTPTLVKGALTLTPTSVSAAWGVFTPTIFQGQTLTPNAVSAAFAVATPTIVLGVRTLTPSAVSATWTVFTPTVVRGIRTLTPNAVSAVFTTTTPTVVLGVRTLTPSPITATWSTFTPTVVPGAKVLTPAPATATWAVFTPTVVAGGQPQTLTPSPVTATWSVFTPTVVRGAKVLTPTTITAAWTVITPTVTIGTRVLTPTPITAAWTVTTPSLITGARILTPTPATGFWSVFTPFVDSGATPAGYLGPHGHGQRGGWRRRG